METKKQEAIRKAYEEHWRFYSDMVNSEGGIKDRDFYGSIPDGVRDIKWQTIDQNGTKRPISLKGIENNNGWIPINSENDLPKNTDCYYWYIAGGKLSDIPTNVGSLSDFYNDPTIDEDIKPTHYKIVTPPLLPIY